MIPIAKACWQRPWVRRLLWTLLSIVTIWALGCSWLSWRGARAWSQALNRLEQARETIDFRQCAADPVPDEQNFCAIPLLKDLALTTEAARGRRDLLESISLPAGGASGPPEPGHPNGAAFGCPVDLAPWAARLRTDPRRAVPASGNAASDLLAMFAKDQARFAELAHALPREAAQWTPSWKTRELPANLFAAELPHYQTISHLLQALCLRSIAAAREGNTATAQESVRIALRINEATLQEPFLIGMLVAASNTGRIASAVWELCRAHAGTAADFATLQQSLESIDFHQCALRAYRSELAAAAETLLWLEHDRDPQSFALIDSFGPGRGTLASRALAHALPTGVLTANAASVVNLELEHLILPLRDQGLASSMRKAAELEQQLSVLRKGWLTRLDHSLALLVIPAVSQCTQSASYAQCLADQALIASALERYRLEQGAYPETLAAIKRSNGADLPADIASGNPMGYRKTSDGRYALWCTGPDADDDGGRRNLSPDNPAKTKFRDPQYQGDWVWDFSGPVDQAAP